MDVAARPLMFTGVAGNQLAADQSGPDDAPAVLLMHGGGQTRHSWARARQELAVRGYRAIALDSRGHGDSEWVVDGDYSPDAQVADLIEVVRQVGGQPALVGASMGGVQSLIASGQHPGLATALVLVDVTPRLEMQGIQHIMDFMNGHLEGFDSLEAAAAAIAAYNPNRPAPNDLKGLSKNLRLHQDGRWHWHWDPRFMATDHTKRIALISQRMQAAARNVHVPVMLVRGKQSDVVSPAGVAELKSLLPQLEFVDIEGAGHMVVGDKNDHFNAAIVDFLQRHYPL